MLLKRGPDFFFFFFFFFCSLKGGPRKIFAINIFLHQAPLTSVCERSLMSSNLLDANVLSTLFELTEHKYFVCFVVFNVLTRTL